jgi:hypothetical protein
MHIIAKGKTEAPADGLYSDHAGNLSSVVATVEERIGILTTLRRLHFLFLGVFSGIEFTLTFLTFDRKFSDLSDALQC